MQCQVQLPNGRIISFGNPPRPIQSTSYLVPCYLGGGGGSYQQYPGGESQVDPRSRHEAEMDQQDSVMNYLRRISKQPLRDVLQTADPSVPKRWTEGLNDRYGHYHEDKTVYTEWRDEAINKKRNQEFDEYAESLVRNGIQSRSFYSRSRRAAQFQARISQHERKSYHE